MSESGSDRRRMQRVPLNLLIQYRVDTNDELVCEYASNISKGGIFVRTDEPREVGSMVYLQFVLRNATKLIEGLGKITHIAGPGSDHGGMGIQFINFDDDSIETITALVEERG